MIRPEGNGNDNEEGFNTMQVTEKLERCEINVQKRQMFNDFITILTRAVSITAKKP